MEETNYKLVTYGNWGISHPSVSYYETKADLVDAFWARELGGDGNVVRVEAWEKKNGKWRGFLQKSMPEEEE